ncbi:MAG TPA: ABC transporter permease, partial [Vicinamibacterales bacterium]|nr:ABC transporter permease [Vicinamibacterales bacterium]
MTYEFVRAVVQLKRDWRFAMVVVLLLGVGTGSAGALYSLTHAVLLRPLPIADADRFVAVYPVSSIGTSMGFPFATLAAFDEQQRSLQDLCGFTRGTARVRVAEQYSSQALEAVSGKCFTQWKVVPALGRLIDDGDAALQKEPARVVVLSHAFWQQLGSDPNVIGSALTVEGVNLTVVGVLPRQFVGLDADQAPSVIVPLRLASQLMGTIPRAMWAIGRLRPSATVEGAQAEVNVGWREIWEGTNQNAGPQPTQLPPLRVESLRGGFSEMRIRYRLPLLVLFGLVTVLLTLAVLNVSGVVLTRTLGRGADLTLLLWLGADRSRLFLRLCFEGLVTAVMVIAAAIVTSNWLSQAIAASIWTGRLPLTMRVTPDAGLVAGIAAVCLAGTAIAWLPSLALIKYWDTAGQLALTRGATATSSVLRRSLVAIQAMTTVVLSFCALLFLGDLRAITSIRPGYDPSGLVWTRLETQPGVARSNNPAEYLRELMEKVSARSGATGVAFSVRFPTVGPSVAPGRTFHVTGGTDTAVIEAYFDLVSPEFFDVTRLALLRGRAFSWTDTATQPNVAIVNESLAKGLLGGREPLGERVRVGVAPTGRISTVIGVVRDATLGDSRLVGIPVIYTPLLQQPNLATSPNMLVRNLSSPGFDTLQTAVSELGRHYVTNVTPLESQNKLFLARENTLVRLSLLFAIVGLTLCSSGMYAVVAFDMHRRSREIAVRVALGST